MAPLGYQESCLSRIVPGPVAVVGAGLSGRSAARLVLSLGGKVRLLDDRPDALRGPPPGAEIGALSARALKDVSLVVLSPGVPRCRPELAQAIADNQLVSEIELASWFLGMPLIGITGTNGKSTTTALAGHIAKQAGLRVFVGGNFGEPLSELARNELEGRLPAVEIAFIELSSYQLESTRTTRLQIGAWLNLQPDHMDRYPSLEAYAEAKARILELIAKDGCAILPTKDSTIARFAGRAESVRWVAVEEQLESGQAGIEIVNGIGRRGSEEYKIAGPGLMGLHNHQNAGFAIELVRTFGLEPSSIQAALLSFQGLPHRLTLISELDNVQWFDDSKATNVASAVTAVQAMVRPTILIAGGRDKRSSWDALVQVSEGVVKCVLAIGEASATVESAFKGCVEVEIVETLEAAVLRARVLAEPGDAVLLAPACASFDQFSSYTDRGLAFTRLVRGKK